MVISVVVAVTDNGTSVAKYTLCLDDGDGQYHMTIDDIGKDTILAALHQYTAPTQRLSDTAALLTNEVVEVMTSLGPNTPLRSLSDSLRHTRLRDYICAHFEK